MMVSPTKAWQGAPFKKNVSGSRCFSLSLTHKPAGDV
jgi:hypothetical protein